MLRPGLNMKDLYWAIREDVEKSSLIPSYPRGNLGHSVGCGHHAEEYPTISKDRDFVLQPGMVICLETPYSAIGGAPVHGGFKTAWKPLPTLLTTFFIDSDHRFGAI